MGDELERVPSEFGVGVKEGPKARPWRIRNVINALLDSGYCTHKQRLELIRLCGIDPHDPIVPILVGEGNVRSQS